MLNPPAISLTTRFRDGSRYIYAPTGACSLAMKFIALPAKSGRERKGLHRYK